MSFKAPKTKAGRRDVTLPDIVVETLREHRRRQVEQRMALRLGKLPDDAFVFPASTAGPRLRGSCPVTGARFATM
ncbi:MAG: hypothetical protein HYX38_13585 [Rhodospirillales bacterium]|nr:hypothetical protein [Rhodospirillales bacterium]